MRSIVLKYEGRKSSEFIKATIFKKILYIQNRNQEFSSIYLAKENNKDQLLET